MKKLYAAAVATVLGCSIGILAQEVRRDGKWEVTTLMSMPNMPAPMPPSTNTVCVTKEDAADPQKAAQSAVPAGRGPAQNDCKMSDYKVVGSRVSYTMTCTTPQAMKMSYDVVYGVDKYDGTITMDVARGGQTMQMTQKVSAKRLGDCVK
jgi:hypothetical protein